MSPGRLSSAVTSAVTLGSGLSLAIIPAAILSISSALFPLEEQGIIAVSIMASTFVGQLAYSWVVEARLASPGSDRRLVMPRVLGTLAIMAAIALAVIPSQAIVLALCLPLLLAALEVARGVSIAERLDRREWVAAAAVAVGAGTGVIAGLLGLGWALAPLALGVAIATAVRLAPVSHLPSRANPATRTWVLVDSASTGVIYPLLNAVILAQLGAAESVLFTALATVSGVLAIPLNFLRFRLLKESSPVDVIVTAATVVIAIVALLVADALGLFGLLFGTAWSNTDVLPALLIACAWRASVLATTLPFAALRRAGAASLVAVLRLAVSIITFGLAWLAVLGGLEMVFLALLVSEFIATAIYETARRRVVSRSQVGP